MIIELALFAALLLFLGLAGWKIERDVDRSLLEQERRQAKYHICIVPERNGKIK